MLTALEKQQGSLCKEAFIPGKDREVTAVKRTGRPWKYGEVLASSAWKPLKWWKQRSGLTQLIFICLFVYLFIWWYFLGRCSTI
jgi:hypothetical protein